MAGRDVLSGPTATRASASTTARTWMATGSSSQLRLSASARPALLTIGLWDNDVKDADDALAFEDVRLSAGGGEHSVKMVGSKGSGCKHVTVSFTVAVVEDA